MKAFLSSLIIISFLFTSFDFPQAYAQPLLGLPEPGTMVNLSPAYQPVLIKGLKVHPENPFQFDFIVDTGHSGLKTENPQFKEQSQTLIKYFLASLTVPEKDLWVNLSPYEKDRMIAPNLGATAMGRDMLAQDYILKQLTASLIYPEHGLGKKFWDKVYAKAQEMYGTTQIPVNTFNKVWITADKADVLERGNTAYVVGAHLKVMLEEDRAALQNHTTASSHSAASQVVREVILPAIEQEVNQGRNFAPLRQMFYSMILASWYKVALKDALLTQIYGNQSKVKVGVNQNDPKANQEIFNRYLEAYKKGVFSYIKEETGQSGVTVPKKYFSGGTDFAVLANPKVLRRIGTLPPGIQLNVGDMAMVSGVGLPGKADAAMTAQLQPVVLLVEHRQLIRQAMQSALQMEGYTVITAYNDEQARMIVEGMALHNNLSLVVANTGSVSRGISFYNFMKNYDRFYHVPFILLHKYGSYEELEALNATQNPLDITAIREKEPFSRTLELLVSRADRVRYKGMSTIENHPAQENVLLMYKGAQGSTVQDALQARGYHVVLVERETDIPWALKELGGSLSLVISSDDLGGLILYEHMKNSPFSKAPFVLLKGVEFSSETGRGIDSETGEQYQEGNLTRIEDQLIHPDSFANTVGQIIRHAREPERARLARGGTVQAEVVDNVIQEMQMVPLRGTFIGKGASYRISDILGVIRMLRKVAGENQTSSNRTIDLNSKLMSILQRAGQEKFDVYKAITTALIERMPEEYIRSRNREYRVNQLPQLMGWLDNLEHKLLLQEPNDVIMFTSAQSSILGNTFPLKKVQSALSALREEVKPNKPVILSYLGQTESTIDIRIKKALIVFAQRKFQQWDIRSDDSRLPLTNWIISDQYLGAYKEWLTAVESAIGKIVSNSSHAVNAPFGLGTVLVVDDEIREGNAVRYELARRGYVVLNANDGSDALLYLNDPSNQISLVISDHHMPNKSGEELLDEMWKDATLRSIPFIFRTSALNGEGGRRGRHLTALFERGKYTNLKGVFSKQDDPSVADKVEHLIGSVADAAMTATKNPPVVDQAIDRLGKLVMQELQAGDIRRNIVQAIPQLRIHSPQFLDQMSVLNAGIIRSLRDSGRQPSYLMNLIINGLQAASRIGPVMEAHQPLQIIPWTKISSIPLEHGGPGFQYLGSRFKVHGPDDGISGQDRRLAQDMLTISAIYTNALHLLPNEQEGLPKADRAYEAEMYSFVYAVAQHYQLVEELVAAEDTGRNVELTLPLEMINKDLLIRLGERYRTHPVPQSVIEWFAQLSGGIKAPWNTVELEVRQTALDMLVGIYMSLTRSDQWIMSGYLRNLADGADPAISKDYVKGFFSALNKERERLPNGTNVVETDSAMTSETPGGIELNRANLQMNVRKEGFGVEMKFDPAMIERIKREGFDGLDFQIQSIISVTNLPVLLGLQP